MKSTAAPIKSNGLNIVLSCKAALDTIEHLPNMSELDYSSTVQDISKAVDQLEFSKDCIPDKGTKICISRVPVPLHKRLLKCLEESEVPQDMRDDHSLTLYKNKGHRSNTLRSVVYHYSS